MSNTILPSLLTDTLNLVQLARESALAQGRQQQAQKLEPVVDNLMQVVQSARENQHKATPSFGVTAQADFQKLLEAARSTPAGLRSNSTVSSITEKHQVIRSMAEANMLDVDIARQMGMTRDEVRQVLSIGGKVQKVGG